MIVQQSLFLYISVDMQGQRTAALLFDNTEYTSPKPERKGRSEELIEQRNELFIHRFYWYQVFTTHKYEEVMRRLQMELHLAEFTLGKMVREHANEIMALRKKKPSQSYFKKKYDWMVWNAKAS